MKIFVTLDTQNTEFFTQMTEWKNSDGNKYDLVNALDLLKKLDKEDDEVLKDKLHKLMDECKVVAVVVSKETKSFKKFTRWQMEYAKEAGKPIICLNTNGIRSVDFDRCTAFMKKNLSLHIAFQNEIFEYALNNWPNDYKEKLEKEEKKTYRYSNEVYESLGLHTADFA